MGETAQLERLRGGASETIVFPVEAAPVADESAISSIAGNSRFAGVTVRQLDPALSEEKGLPYDAAGVIVTGVEPGSPADAMGLQVDDIILALNNTPVKSAEELRNMIDKTGKVAAILVQRNDAKIFIPVDLG